MAEHVRGAGIVLEADDEWTVDPPLRMRAGARAVPADPVARALSLQELDVVDEVVVTRAGAATRGTPSEPKLRVPVAHDEDAVVLVEDDGVYEWILPDRDAETGMRASRGSARTFTVPIAPRMRSRGGRARASAVRAGGFKAWVLRFVAGAATSFAIDVLERKVVTRLVDMRAPDPAEWSTLADARAVPDARVLLFLHGTFSSTLGSYHALGRESFLAWARERYTHVIGYDHATLSLDPIVNAADLLSRLRERFVAPRLDVVAYSRGGLVARSLLEQLVPASSWQPRDARLAMIGCTNDGTHLAEPANWKAFVDTYTTLAAHAIRAAGVLAGAVPVSGALEAALRSVGALVKFLAVHAVEENAVPGLAAMRPKGRFVSALNEGPRAADKYFALTSEFSPSFTGEGSLPKKLRDWLLDHTADAFFDVANDLVVDTPSMNAIDGEPLANTVKFEANENVHHLCYFAQQRTNMELKRFFET